MKNDTKKRLFEIMQRVDNTFKPKLNEWYDDDYGKAPKQPKGIGDFNSVDWRILFEVLVNNYYVANGKKPDSIGYNYSDMTGYDGFLSREELQHLENWGLIEKMGAFPVIGDKYGNFDAFYNKAKEIWNKEAPSSGNNDSEAPYLRGNEPTS